MKLKLLSVLLLSVLLIGFVMSNEEEVDDSSSVFIITPDTIGEYVNSVSLIEFFAPWCGHCKRLAPIYSELAKHYNLVHQEKGVKIGSVNCVDYAEMCGGFGIRGYPTIKFFNQGNEKEYRGGRDMKSFIDYVEQMTKSPVVEVDNENQLKEYLSKPETNSFIFLSSSNETLNNQWNQVFNHIGIKIQDTISPYFIKLADSSLISHVPKRLPAVILFKDDRYSEYNGDLENLEEWIKLNQYPLVSQLSGDRVSGFGQFYKYIVLFVFESKISESEMDTIKSIARTKVSENQKESDFIYLYFTDSTNKRWLAGHNLGEKPTIVVFTSETLDLYHYDSSITKLDPESYLNFLKSVYRGEQPLLYTDPLNYFIHVTSSFITKYQYFLIAFSLSIPIIIYYTCCTGSSSDDKEKEN